ncbi:MAG: DUF1801 domain-containing protein [Myxococcaceae bacterium]|nr:DUF1801 domain-containing protein [Myxococcaceae bacterium]
MRPSYATVAQYLAAAPPPQRTLLKQLRTLVLAAAPKAKASIGYGIVCFRHQDRVLVYLGAARAHCALYAVKGGTRRYPLGVAPPAREVKALVAARRRAVEAAAAKAKTRRR